MAITGPPAEVGDDVTYNVPTQQRLPDKTQDHERRVTILERDTDLAERICALENAVFGPGTCT